MSKTKQSPARKFIGKTVRYEYSTPAVSCCSSHRVKMEGVVTSLRHNPSPYFGRDTLIVRTDETRNFVSITEVTHAKDQTGRWRKLSQGKPKKAIMT